MRCKGKKLPLALPLRLLRLLGGVMRAFGHALPFGREPQPGLAGLVAQRAGGLVAALIGLFQIVIGFTLRHARDCGSQLLGAGKLARPFGQIRPPQAGPFG